MDPFEKGGPTRFSPCGHAWGYRWGSGLAPSCEGSRWSFARCGWPIITYRWLDEEREKCILRWGSQKVFFLCLFVSLSNSCDGRLTSCERPNFPSLEWVNPLPLWFVLEVVCLSWKWTETKIFLLWCVSLMSFFFFFPPSCDVYLLWKLRGWTHHLPQFFVWTMWC